MNPAKTSETALKPSIIPIFVHIHSCLSLPQITGLTVIGIAKPSHTTSARARALYSSIFVTKNAKAIMSIRVVTNSLTMSFHIPSILALSSSFVFQSIPWIFIHRFQKRGPYHRAQPINATNVTHNIIK